MLTMGFVQVLAEVVKEGVTGSEKRNWSGWVTQALSSLTRRLGFGRFLLMSLLLLSFLVGGSLSYSSQWAGISGSRVDIFPLKVFEHLQRFPPVVARHSGSMGQTHDKYIESDQQKTFFKIGINAGVNSTPVWGEWLDISGWWRKGQRGSRNRWSVRSLKTTKKPILRAGILINMDVGSRVEEMKVELEKWESCLRCRVAGAREK